MKITGLSSIIITGVLGVSLFSCDSPDSDDIITEDESIINESTAFNTVFDDKIFSIPSPVQTAFLIKEMDLEFNSEILNSPKKSKDYILEDQQALNLGVFGMDLGYTALHKQKGVALKYLEAVEDVSNKLELDSTFNTGFLLRFEKNSDNQDSMILMMSEAFTQVDNYLKGIGRKSTSALVLAGGWTESLHLACQIENEKSSEDLRNRIAEQKVSLGTLIELLTEYNQDDKITELIDMYKDLQVIFDDVSINYEYSPPETIEDKSLTILNNTTSIVMSAPTLNSITQKIEEIRSFIIK